MQRAYGDQHQFSPDNTHTYMQGKEKVVRIDKTITKEKLP